MVMITNVIKPPMSNTGIMLEKFKFLKSNSVESTLPTKNAANNVSATQSTDRMMSTIIFEKTERFFMGAPPLCSSLSQNIVTVNIKYRH